MSKIISASQSRIRFYVPLRNLGIGRFEINSKTEDTPIYFHESFLELPNKYLHKN